MSWLHDWWGYLQDNAIGIIVIFLGYIAVALWKIEANVRPILYILQRKHERETGDKILD